MTAEGDANHSTNAATSRTRWPQRRRWITVLVLSLLAHLVLLDALPHWSLQAADDGDDEPLRARLVPVPLPAPLETPVPAPAKPVPRKDVTPKPRVIQQQPEFVPESHDDAIPEITVGEKGAASSPAPAIDVAPTPAPPVVPQPTPQPAPPPAPDASPPQSARLAYKVVAVDLKNASPISYYGVGSIDWSIEGDRYRADLVAAVDFLFFKANVLASHSEGAVVPQGLAPDRYTETPRKRATLATNFNRDARQTISFSATPATMPLAGGAQDRLSILFQLGAWLRADPALATSGRIDIVVAGVRDVETWSLDAQGVETIETGAGPVVTAHFRREPRAGSNDRTIDVWIAHEAGGYPARVLYTEPNGSTIDMTLRKIEAAPPAPS